MPFRVNALPLQSLRAEKMITSPFPTKTMKRLYDFFRQGHLWDNDDSSWSLVSRIVLHPLRRFIMAVQQFAQRNLSNHAAALTYSSILGAVPILAIVFAIARGFGFGQLIEEKLQANVNFSPEMTATIMDFVNNYLERARGGIFIGVGLLLLFYTLFSLTSNIETAFNAIWQVNRSRNIYRRAVYYVSIFFLLPIVIILTSGLQVFLSGIGRFLPDVELFSNGLQLILQLVPYVLACFAFVLLYKLMPNTTVHWRACIVPGIIAGTAFQGFQWFYINSQMWLSSYDAVYGSFAAIPFFMLFIQISWMICLFGAQLSYVHQHEAALIAQKQKSASEPLTREQLAVAALHSIKKIVAEYEEQLDD